MFDEMKETLWSIILACLIGAFCRAVSSEQRKRNHGNFRWHYCYSLLAGCLLFLLVARGSTQRKEKGTNQ